MMIMAYAPHDDFRSLYDAYTGPGSTAEHLTKHMVRLTERDPLLVVTGSDFVVFPGSGRAPIVESFRHSTGGLSNSRRFRILLPASRGYFACASSAMPIGVRMQSD